MNFKKLKISQKLSLFTGSLLIIIVLFLLLSFNTVETSKVNSDLYKEIVLGKDLLADILPPPEYIIESYLVCNQLYFEKNEATILELVKTLERLHSEYIERHQYWVDNLEEGSTKQILLNDSYLPAENFYNIVFAKYLPAIYSKNHVSADLILNTELKSYYESHRKAIDEVVKLANERNITKEENANTIISNSIIIMMVLAIVFILISIIISIIVIKSITKPINNATRIALSMSEGNFDEINKYNI